jgi:ferredoxin
MFRTEGNWDFQGASGAASVVPGLAGIALAAWAIFYQMRVSSPSYRSAEAALMEVWDFRRAYTRIASLLSASVPDGPIGDESVGVDLEDHFGPSVNIKDAISHSPYSAKQLMSRALTQKTRLEANKKIKLDRAAREMRIDIEHSCSGSKGCGACDAEANAGRKSFAIMTSQILPLLDTLQQHKKITLDLRIDITATEEMIDFFGNTYGDWDENYDSHNWCESVMQIIFSLDQLISVLQRENLLNPSLVEKALLMPKQSRDISEFHNEVKNGKKILAEQQSRQKPSDRAKRFGAVGEQE